MLTIIQMLTSAWLSSTMDQESVDALVLMQAAEVTLPVEVMLLVGVMLPVEVMLAVDVMLVVEEGAVEVGVVEVEVAEEVVEENDNSSF